MPTIMSDIYVGLKHICRPFCGISDAVCLFHLGTNCAQGGASKPPGARHEPAPFNSSGEPLTQ